MFNFAQEYEEKRAEFIAAKERKEEVEKELKHQRDLNKPLQERMENVKKTVANVEIELKQKVGQIQLC